MKNFFVILSVLIAVASAQVQKELPEALKKVFDECAEKAGGHEVVLNQSSPKFDAEKMKCFHACVLKGNDAMVDGKILPDKFEEHIMTYKPEMKDDMKQKIMECINKANEMDGECEVAVCAHDCITGVMKAA